jgi:hypothetical protein
MVTGSIFVEPTGGVYVFSASFLRPVSASTTSFLKKVKRKKINEKVFHVLYRNKDCRCCEKEEILLHI